MLTADTTLSPAMCNTVRIIDDLLAVRAMLAFPEPVEIEGETLMELIDLVQSLPAARQHMLVKCVLAGLDLELFVVMYRCGLALDVYFDAVEHELHPALPLAAFSEQVEALSQINPPEAIAAMLESEEGIVEIIVQTRFIENLHALLLHWHHN